MSGDSDSNSDTFVIQLRGQTDRRGEKQNDFIETQNVVLYACKLYTTRSMGKSNIRWGVQGESRRSEERRVVGARDGEQVQWYEQRS